MTVTVITPPLEEPVTLAEAKSYLRVDGTDLDGLISDEITNARQFCERYTGLMLITQSVSVLLDAWPKSMTHAWWSGVKDGHIDQISPSVAAVSLPVGPVQSLDGIDLLDEDHTEITVTPLPAYVTTGLMPLLVRKNGYQWPVPLRAVKGIQVRLVVGFGTPAQVPFALKQGILQLLSHRFDHPASAEVPSGVKTLWSSYRRVGL